MRKKGKFVRLLMLLMIVAIMTGTAGAGTTEDATSPSVTLEPGLTRVVIPAALGVPAPLPAPLAIAGAPKATVLKPKMEYVQCAPKPSSTSQATAASCGGGSSGVTYWWQGVFWVGSRAGTWYEFVQEFEWHVQGATITSVSLNICYSRSGSWHHHGCGGPGEHDGSPRIVQSSSSTRRVLAEWDYHFHRTDDYQAPNTDIRFGADGSIVGTVWYQ